MERNISYIVDSVQIAVLQHFLDRLPVVCLLLGSGGLLRAVALERLVDVVALILAFTVEHVGREARELSDDLVERVKRVA